MLLVLVLVLVCKDVGSGFAGEGVVMIELRGGWRDCGVV